MIMQIIVFSFLASLGIGCFVMFFQWAVVNHLRKKMFNQEKEYLEREKKALKNQKVSKRKK